MKRYGIYQVFVLLAVLLLNVRCGATPSLTPAISTETIPSGTSTSEPTLTPVLPSPTSIPTTGPNNAEWIDQIIYVLIPHKFYDGNPKNNFMKDQFKLPNTTYINGFLGGDIAGIRKKMDYLKGLGITSVLLYPILSNNEGKSTDKFLPSGYAVRDYHTVDVNFGTNEDFTQLIADLHALPRINIILDLPMAVTGTEHQWAQDPNSFIWYYRPWNSANPSDNIGDGPYFMPYGAVDNSLGGLIINHTQGIESGTSTYRAVRDDIVFWLVDHFEIDGIRYDSAHSFYPAFWPKLLTDFRNRYGETKPNFWHIAEVLNRFPKKSWQLPAEEFINETSPLGAIRMGGIYDFELINYLPRVFGQGEDAKAVTEFKVDLLKHLVNTEKYEYPEKLMASIDFYEDPTFLNLVTNGNETEKLYLASVFLLTINRVPLIYSGNECGIDYHEPGELFDKCSGQEFLAKSKQLIQIRTDHAAFRRGSLTPLYSEFSSTVISYARQYENQTFVIILNNAATTQSIELKLEEQGITCRNPENLLSNNDQTVKLIDPGNNNTLLSLTLIAWEPKIIKCE